MGIDEKEFEETKKTFVSTATDAGFRKEMAQDLIAYVQRQLNDFSLKGAINFAQYSQLLEEAELGLFELIYLGYYNKGMDVIDYDPLYISTVNLLRLGYTRVLQGADRELIKAEIESKRPIMISGGK